MKKYDWKEKYYTPIDTLVTSATYFSKTGSPEGNGSREFPYAEYPGYFPGDGTYIYGAGQFNIVFNPTLRNFGYIIGQGMEQTIVDLHRSSNLGAPAMRDITLNSFTGTARYSLAHCISKTTTSPVVVNAYNSVMYWNIPSGGSQVTFVEVIQPNLLNTKPLLNRCTIDVTQTYVNNNANNFIAFNDCLFQIGNETEATKLSGSNADELRQNFAERCEAQGIALKEISEYREINTMGRWIFSNNSITGDYNTLRDSEIDHFAKKRNIYFGHTADTVINVPISSDPVNAMSFTTSNPVSEGITVSDHSITFDTATMTGRKVMYADSNIIWLGGKYQLESINILDNLPRLFGVTIDGIFSFGEPAGNDDIEADTLYIVRSSDNQTASIKYNNKIYTTDLTNRTNIFKSIAGISLWETVSGNPVVMPVVKAPNFSNVQMRIVSELPDEEIKTGNLQAGYWYFVSPDTMEDTSGTVTYDGRQYPCFSSFLVSSPVTFSIDGNCHLRRCWRQDYNNPDDETIDKIFWENRQKPKFFDIVPNDLRCLLKDNSPLADEMQSDEEGNYMTSGHIDFYPKLDISSGFALPVYPITGAFMQLRISISTQNPI